MKPIKLLITDERKLDAELMALAFSRYHRKIRIVQSNPDVSIVPSAMACRAVRTADPEAYCIVLIDAGNSNAIVEAFQSGAHGIFSRDGTFQELYEGVERVAEGHIWANNRQLKHVIEFVASGGATKIVSATGKAILTMRECSIVELVAQGNTNRNIAASLGLSEHTIRNYLFKIFNKLGTSSRLELAIYAMKNKRETEKELAAAN